MTKTSTSPGYSDRPTLVREPDTPYGTAAIGGEGVSRSLYNHL